MRFKNTFRCSPVVNMDDLPREGDLFHFRPSDIPKLKKQRIEFLKDNNIFIDKEWWYKQASRCIYGYDVPDAIERGGDAIVDGEDAIWDGNDCYLPQYDLLIKNSTIHITGRYYFYINFWPIYALLKGQTVKGLTTPLFTDLDFLFARRVEMMYTLYKDDQEAKSRQQGFSEKMAGMLVGYNYTFINSSVNVIVAGVSDDSEHTMENTIRGLDDLINTQFYQERKKGGDNAERIISKKNLSQVISLTAKDNNQTVSRLSPSLVIYEEVGKGKKEWSINTAAFVQPSIIAQNGIKTGWEIFLGTGGEMEEGVYDIEQRFYHPEKYNILEFKNTWSGLSTELNSKVGHFSPKWWMKVLDEDGNSLKQKGIELINEEYEKSSNKDKYRFRTQNPITIEEMFRSSSSGFFGEEIIKNLNNIYSLILNHSYLQVERRGILEFINPKKPFEGVRFVAKSNGWLNIIEEPVKDETGKVWLNLYEASTDPYDQDIAMTSTSEGALYVKKKYLPGQAIYKNWVAELIERPSIEEGGAETFFLHTIMVCIWYKCLNFIEYSNKRIFDYYKINGFESLLRQRARLAFADKVSNSRVTNQYGYDPNLKPHILSILREGLTEEVIMNMRFTRQIKALSKYVYDPSGKKYNCDITIATAGTEVACKETEFQIARKQDEIITKTKYRSWKTVNGRLECVYA